MKLLPTQKNKNILHQLQLFTVVEELKTERLGWAVLILLSLAGAIPYLIFRFLPLVDFPLHQLELAIWIEPPDATTEFWRYYERAPYTLPYWLPLFMGRFFSLFTGAEAASRWLVFLYAFCLPLAGGILARSSRRSAWWGLFLVPFVYEFNLSYGFTAYCMGGLLFLLALAAMLRIEDLGTVKIIPFFVFLCLLIGWTHPQMAILTILAVGVLQLLNRKNPLRLRLIIISAALAAAVPTALWLLTGASGSGSLFSKPEFASLLELAKRLPDFSINVFPENVEEIIFFVVVFSLLSTWIRSADAFKVENFRLAFLFFCFILLYFLTPWDLGGQAICQRMPYLALLLLPVLTPPGKSPSKIMKLILTTVCILGLLNSSLHLFGFKEEAKKNLNSIIEQAPQRAKLVYIAYDVNSTWVNAPVYLHSGALITLSKGGCYAFHFNRLTSRFTSAVPPDATFIGRELRFSRFRNEKGNLLVVPLSQLPFWDTMLVRWPDGKPGVIPLEAEPGRIESLYVYDDWGLFKIRR